MDLTKGDMLIMSGEGTGEGTIERYEGARTIKAIRARLSRERAGGDRWAEAWIDMLIDDSYGDTVYGKLNADLGEIIDQRAIPASAIRTNPAAILGRKGRAVNSPAQQAASRAAGKAPVKPGSAPRGRPKAGTVWVAPGEGATAGELRIAGLFVRSSLCDVERTRLALTGEPINAYDQRRADTLA